jgi:hypothetical protein
MLGGGARAANQVERVAWGDWGFVGDNREEVLHCEQAGALDFAEGAVRWRPTQTGRAKQPQSV